MANRHNSNRIELWRDRIRRQAASGLNVVQFCIQEPCAHSAFYRWKRYLESIDASDQFPASRAAVSGPLAASPSTFLPVTVRLLNNNAPDSAPVEADLPNGVRLRISTADAFLACRLIRALAGAKTNAGGSH